LPVSIDALTLTVPNGKVREIIAEWCALLGVPRGVERKNGLHGYERSVDISGYALIAFGGSNQRGTVLVSVNGAGCHRVHSFRSVQAWAESVSARITRVDIAADDHNGKIFTVARALKAWRAGAFKVVGRGRPVDAELVDDLGSGKGKTLYVGSRLAGKLCRIYEKGKQLKDADSVWVRAEVELLAKDRTIPLDLLVNPIPYLAASYPFFEFLSFVLERIPTLRKAAIATLDSATKWLRSIGGKTINALVLDAGGDLAAVVTRIRRSGIPAKLVPYFHYDGNALHTFSCPAPA
jgi:phage replication initiation protein